MRSPIRLLLLALGFSLGFAATAAAGDYASAISAYRRAHGLSAVRSDGRLGAVALKQAQAMASTGTVSHSAGGNFATRVSALRKSRAAENIGAGFLTFAEMLKQWEASTGHRAESADGRRPPRRRRLGGQSEIALPEVLGDGDHGLNQHRHSGARASANPESRADYLEILRCAIAHRSSRLRLAPE